MSYVVQVSESAEERIASWGLSPDLLDQVEQRLSVQLAEQGPNALRRVRAPVDAWLYSFVLPDAAVPRRKHFFQFQVVISQDEQALVVVGAGYSSQQTGDSPFGPEERN